MSLVRSTHLAKNHVDLRCLEKKTDLRDLLERIVRANPDKGYHRVICPLKEKTKVNKIRTCG